MSEVAKSSFNVHADPQTGKMRISLTSGGVALGSLELGTKEASNVAAVVLGAAKRSYEVSAKSPSDMNDEAVTYTPTTPSGWRIGPGRERASTTILFQYGEASLGIELPNPDAQLLAERLTKAAADGQLREASLGSELPNPDAELLAERLTKAAADGQPGAPEPLQEDVFSGPPPPIVAPDGTGSLRQRGVVRSGRAAPSRLPLGPPDPQYLLLAAGCVGIIASIIVIGLRAANKRNL